MVSADRNAGQEITPRGLDDDSVNEMRKLVPDEPEPTERRDEQDGKLQIKFTDTSRPAYVVPIKIKKGKAKTGSKTVVSVIPIKDTRKGSKESPAPAGQCAEATECKSLVELSKARRALAAASSFDDVLAIRDKAVAARAYAKAAQMSLETANEAMAVKLLAERKAGEMLAGAGLSKGRKCNVPLHLDDIGVNRMQSSRWQRLASIPDDAFEQFIVDAKEAGRELTTAGALKFAKQLTATSPTEAAVWDGETGHTSSLDELIATGETFSTIYADPPWQYGNQATRASTNNHYATMSLDDLSAMPVESLAAADAHLWLWTTTSFLKDAFYLMARWGFTYKTNVVWEKPQMGLGNYVRVCHEHLLLGVRGSLTTAANDQRSVIRADRAGHSVKPDDFRAIVERLSPGPFLELFGRKPVDGWTVFGNQVEPLETTCVNGGPS